MDLFRSMRVFRSVVEAGSFAVAAKKLRISSAWASKHVSQLEEHLGAQLLRRTTRSLSVTESGRVYYQRACEILDGVDEVEESIGALSGGPRGKLRVTAPMSFGILHLAPALPAFSRSFPEVTLDLTLTDRVVDLIEEGFDLAVRILPQLPDSRLVARKLFSGERVLCAAPSYLEERGTPTSLAGLTGHNCLVYSLHATPNEWTFDGPGGGRRSVRIAGNFISNNSIVIRESLLAGTGISLIPEFLVSSDLREGRLIALLPAHRPTSLAAYAVYPLNRQASPKLRAFLDFLVETLNRPTSKRKRNLRREPSRSRPVSMAKQAVRDDDGDSDPSG